MVTSSSFILFDPIDLLDDLSGNREAIGFKGLSWWVRYGNFSADSVFFHGEV